MIVSKQKVRKYLHASLTGLMAVWLSGVVFLFCCHSVGASPAGTDTCPLAKMSAHCDKAKKQNANSHVVEPSLVDCIECGFLPVIFDKSRKIDRVQKQAARAAERIAIEFDPLVFTVTRAKPKTFYTRVPTHDKVFIKNCVFRI